MTFDKNKLVDFIKTLPEDDLDKDDLPSEIGRTIGKLMGGEEADMDFLDGIFTAKAETGSVKTSLIIEEHALKGSAAAQVVLGQLKMTNGVLDNDHFAIDYSDGHNISEAIFWFKRALNGGNPKAGMLLGLVYSGGFGVEVNMFKARKYMKVSADFGVPKAQYLLAVMLLEDLGGSEDEEYAINQMKQAAEWGIKEAIEFFAENDF